MTTRPVYRPKLTRPFYTAENVEFEWANGQSASTKQKNSLRLREEFHKKHPNLSVLEVSTKSDSPACVALSPFNLSLRVPSLRKAFPVEVLYQGSKTFRHGGPYVDLYGMAPQDTLHDPRFNDSGELLGFTFEKRMYPAKPDFLFYVWLYILALLENQGSAEVVKKTDAFCDIEFNPQTGMNNQAKACAIFHSLSQLGLLDQVRDFDQFQKIMMAQQLPQDFVQSGKSDAPAKLDDLRSEKKRTPFKVGDWLYHPTIGRGEVIRKNADGYLVKFNISGPRTLTKDYVEFHCKKIK